MKFVKGFYTNYEKTHIKLLNAIINIKRNEGELTVKNVAKQAGVGLSTAYEHGLQGIIRNLIGKDADEVEDVLKQSNAVSNDELQQWTNKLCKRFGLTVCDTMIYLDMVDDYIEIIGEYDGGCMVVFEVGNPKHFCVTVEKNVLNNRQFVYDTLVKQLGKYKKYMVEIEKEKTGE